MEATFASEHLGWFIFICIVLFLFLVLMFVITHGQRYPMTNWERKRPMVGDDYFKGGERTRTLNFGCSLNAPADLVWRYVKQTNQTKAGWYSYDWLERLCTFKIHNCYLLRDDWSQLKKDDFMWMHQASSRGINLVMGNWVDTIDEDKRVVMFRSDTRVDTTQPDGAAPMKLCYDTVAWSYTFEVTELDELHSRLRVRLHAHWKPFVLGWLPFVLFVFGSTCVMNTGYMSRLRKLCNGTLYISNKYLSNENMSPEDPIFK
ncbi:MAG: hypothetical protein RR434_05755 [Raoultibacter sp.]